MPNAENVCEASEQADYEEGAGLLAQRLARLGESGNDTYEKGILRR